MAHLRQPILYPPPGHPHHLEPPSIVGSTSSSRPAPRRRHGAGSGRSGRGASLLQGFMQQYTNPPVFFDQNPEIQQPATSDFVADSILGGFDLNQPAFEEGVGAHMQQNIATNGFANAPRSDASGNAENVFAPGPRSETSGNAQIVAEEDGEEVSSQPVVPFVGMTFEHLEDAQKVYNDYAWKLGFGVRIGNTKYSQAKNVPKDTILNRLFECVHTGKAITEKQEVGSKTGVAASLHSAPIDLSSNSPKKSRSKQAGVQMDMSDSRQRNIVLRHDCKAHMLVGKRQGVWTVTVFKEEHTHPMVKQIGRRRFYRSHRKVPEEDFQFLQTLHNQNISTAQIMGCLGSVHGGDPRCLGYVKRDVSNIRTMLRNEVTERDMEMTIQYFKQRVAENPRFFYASLQDNNGAIRALFWVDGRTRALYPKYKDCVFFDTTFCTNRYNMPFAPIVGINNHTHTVVLGCALLPDETIETFKWVFQQWMLAMDGQHPDHIMTDQDQAMATAISEIFPFSIHRCCVFHVLRLARTKLGPNLAEGHPFADAFYSCIYGTDTVEEFEACWQQMLLYFRMSENKHLDNMWKSRSTWAPVYFRHRFFPFTSTTGRSEGLNSYFKTLIRPSDSVWNFVQQYELCQVLMLDREENSGFIMEATTAKLWGSYPMEKQALEFYTREIFDRFQKMISASTSFYPVQAEGEGLCYDLVPNPGFDVKTYQVRVVLEDGLYSCGCNTFEMCGLLCAHIIRVMVHLNVQQIPDRYMLRRWSAAAATRAPNPGEDSIRFGVPPTNTLKYNSLCRKMNDLASDACFADDTYEVVSSMVEEAAKKVSAIIRARHDTQQVGAENVTNTNERADLRPGNHNDEAQTVKNPMRVKPKGRPSLKEQRRKPLIELRDEANAKRKKKAKEPTTEKKNVTKTPRKKRVQKCPFCYQEGHVVTDCIFMKAKLSRDAELAAGAELRL